MNKKFGEKLGLMSLLTILSTSFVSAGPVDGLRVLLEGLRDLIIVIFQFTGDVVLDLNSFDEYLFIRIILFTLIFIIINQILRKNQLISHDKKINTIIAISITILSMRFMDADLISAIILPYTALGASILIFLPFIIYFFFIHQSSASPFVRRAGWVVFGISLMAIWGFDDSGRFSSDIVTYMYLGGLTFVLISLLFDRSIHKYFAMHEYRGMKESLRFTRRVKAIKRMKELEDAKEHISEREYELKRRELERTITDNS